MSPGPDRSGNRRPARRSERGPWKPSRRAGPRREERTGPPGERPGRPGERSAGGGRPRAARPQRSGWTPPERGGWQPPERRVRESWQGSRPGPERAERRYSSPPRERPFRGKAERGPRRFEPNDIRSRPPATQAGPPAESQDAFAAGAPSDLIWGRHAAEAALECGRPLHRIWCTPELRFSSRFLQRLREAKASGVLVEEVSWARLGQISGGAVHQGIVLQPAAADTLDLDSLIEGCRQLGEPPLLIAVDGLTDPQNLGAIVRSAEALGAHGMVLPQRRNAGLTGSVAKVAAGALEHLPVARVVNLNRSLEALQEEGYRVIGLAEQGNLTLEEADLDGPLVVVTGSEADGLSMLTRRHCDQLVRIPLRGVTPSLNASVATALLLYEVARRGWMRGLRGAAPAPRLRRPATAAEPAPPAASAEAAPTDVHPAAPAEPEDLPPPPPAEAAATGVDATPPPPPSALTEPGPATTLAAATDAPPAGEFRRDTEEPLRFSSDVSL